MSTDKVDDGFEEDSDFYLKLANKKITFEGVSKSQLTSVFFDEANAQVFSISSGDVTDVKVKSPIESFCSSFKITEKGRIVSIKFSFDQTILALQRTQTAVDFLTFEDGKVSKEFTQTFKGCNLLTYLWTGKTEIVLVTNVSVKLCKVDMRSGTLTTLKSLNLSVNWYNYYSPINLLLVSLANASNVMQLLQIKQNQIVKLVKFDIDDEYVSLTKKFIADRDIVLGVVYNQPRILFLNVHTTSAEAEVIVYTIIKLSSIKKTHVLRINQSGRFALNIVDNLIIVHNQITKTSIVFDITNAEFQGAVKFHNPVLEPKSIKPFQENVPSSSQKNVYELYNPNWVMFQPNIIMDAKAGCLWFIEIDLFGFYKHIEDKRELIAFLLLRSNSKMVIAKTLETLLEDGFNKMEELADIFDQINFVYRSYLEENMKSQMGLPSSMTRPEEDPVVEFRTVVDQYFIYSYVLCKLAEKVSENVERKESKILTMSLLEYIRSLTDFQIPAQHFLYELLINSLVIQGKFYQLYQLLQYRVVADSKPLACLLLSLENVYNGASQLAVDMLERLGSAREEIIEILLSKQQVMPAIRYAAKHGASNDRNRFAKFLEVAKETGNDKLFYSVSSHFKEN